jgi:hypothetical protein
LAGTQAVVAWQLSQVLLLAMCLPGLPGAVVPLWQPAQVPVTARWSTLAGTQPLVAWQPSQELALATWVAGLPVAVTPSWQAFLPVAVTPSWQAEHVPTTARWSTRTVAHLLVTWQSSHALVLRMCCAGLPVALVPLWQP